MILFLQGCFEQSNTVPVVCWEVCSQQITGIGSLPGAAALVWAEGLDCRDWGLSCAPALRLWSRTRYCSRWLDFFFNLHFLNYSKSCQVHIHNRKVTNHAVILKMKSADAVTNLETFLRRERGSGLDHLLPALWSESGWHDAFSGRKPDKLLLYKETLQSRLCSGILCIPRYGIQGVSLLQQLNYLWPAAEILSALTEMRLND